MGGLIDMSDKTIDI